MSNQIEVNWYAIKQELDAAAWGQKQGIRRRIQNELGINRDKFYREMRKRFGKAKEIERDKRIPRHLVKLIAEDKIRGYSRADDEREMSTKRCIKRLVRKGIPGADQLTVSSVNRILRDEFGFRERTPRQRWEAEYALQEVQIDFSHSKYYKIVRYDEERDDWLLKASGIALSYKKNPYRLKPILTQAIDKYSRLRLVRCYPGANESTRIMRAHLDFWLRRTEDEHQMHHLPFELAHDNGAPFRSEEFTQVIDALQIAHRTSIPYEKTGIGQIENRWKPIWQIELDLSADYEFLWLSEYNMLIHEEMIADQQEQHPYFNGRKGDLYQQSILRHRPYSLDVDIADIACKTGIRTVRETLTISFDGEQYRVPQYVGDIPVINKQVRVSKNLRGKLIGELVNVHASEFELEPFEHRTKGDFSGSYKRTFRQHIEDNLKQGKSMYDSVITENGERVDPDTGEILPKPTTSRLSPRRQTADVDSPFARSAEPESERFDSPFEAKKWIGIQLKPFGLDYGDLASRFDAWIDELDLNKEAIEAKLNEFLTAYKQSKTA